MTELRDLVDFAVDHDTLRELAAGNVPADFRAWCQLECAKARRLEAIASTSSATPRAGGVDGVAGATEPSETVHTGHPNYVRAADLKVGQRVVMPGDDCDQIVQHVMPSRVDRHGLVVHTNGGRWSLNANLAVEVLP